MNALHLSRSASSHSASARTARLALRRLRLLGAAAALLVLLLGACSAPAAEAPAAAAPAAAAPAEAAAVEAASAASAAPQAIAPAAYQEQYGTTGAAHQLIDVRTAEEFASGHIPGAINIPVQELGQRLDEVATDQPIVLYCRSGNRSTQAATLLSQQGYTGIYNLGGITSWQAAGLPIE